MSSSLDIDGKKLTTIASAAKETGYSRDYITRLSREEKIVASQIGRQWFVDIDSLTRYVQVREVEQKIRQRQLSQERKHDLMQKEARERKKNETQKFRQRLKIQSTVMAVMVLGLGLGGGFFLYEKVPSVSTPLERQFASAPLFEHWKKLKQTPASSGSEGRQDIPADAIVTHFSHESVRLATLGEDTNGILLLPQRFVASSTLNPAEFFSNEVTVLVDDEGKRFIARTNENNQIVGKIPFVVVPVQASPLTP